MSVPAVLVPARSPWLGRGVWTVLDHGSFAGVHVAVGVLLARWLVPEGYGAFAVEQAAVLFQRAMRSACYVRLQPHVTATSGMLYATLVVGGVTGLKRAGALVRLASDAALRDRLGRARVAARFRWSALSSDLADRLDSLLGVPPCAPEPESRAPARAPEPADPRAA